ncbi:MAG: superoxide dismutase family protein [Deltaproteobacteria bacterium]|nr:superoxide dismutase family protein [Deltaproteobacteria bacterium]
MNIKSNVWLAGLFLWACGGNAPATSTTVPTTLADASTTTATADATPANAPPMSKAVAVLSPTEGNSVKGTVAFIPEDGKIRVFAKVEGLTPGKHGFHIHEKGDCSAPDGASAGGHFNPEGMDHGGPHATMRHVGDLGNLEANEEGVATLEYVDAHLTLEGEHTIIGKGVIVHAEEDDLISQPTGAAGARVACGVIQ